LTAPFIDQIQHDIPLASSAGKRSESGEAHGGEFEPAEVRDATKARDTDGFLAGKGHGYGPGMFEDFRLPWVKAPGLADRRLGDVLKVLPPEVVSDVLLLILRFGNFIRCSGRRRGADSHGSPTRRLTRRAPPAL
jgi:hypothetical protein